MAPLFKDQCQRDTFKTEGPAEGVLKVSFIVLSQNRWIIDKDPEDRGRGLDLGGIENPEGFMLSPPGGDLFLGLLEDPVEDTGADHLFPLPVNIAYRLHQPRDPLPGLTGEEYHREETGKPQLMADYLPVFLLGEGSGYIPLVDPQNASFPGRER